jgi:DNA-binding IclR family transcriptional regulator
MPVRNHIDLVEKTMRVLEALAESEGEANLKSISAQARLGKSSAFRILYTLKELSYVEQPSVNGVYRLSPRIVALARKTAFAPGLVDVARPHLTKLRDQVRESVWLAQLQHGQVTLIDVAEGPHALQLRYGVGDDCPLHATALGKAVAAYLSSDELKSALGQPKLARFTRHTITSRARLRAELVDVRKNGFATNKQETTWGAIMWGAPIFDSRRRVCAAVSVGVPTARCSQQKRRMIVDLVRSTAAAITADLGRLGYLVPQVGMVTGDRAASTG